jgi:hypothetical protein
MVIFILFVKHKGLRNGKITIDFICGGVLELADRQDLGSCAERREGSSPSFPTNLSPSSLLQIPLFPQILMN